MWECHDLGGKVYLYANKWEKTATKLSICRDRNGSISISMQTIFSFSLV